MANVNAKETDNLKVAKLAIKENRKIKIQTFMKNKMAMVGLIITVIMVIAALLAPVLFPEGPIKMDNPNRFLAPSGAHLFGTDEFGRDILNRTLYGIRISFVIGGVTALITFVLGMLLGLLAGYYSILDNIIMRICEGMMSIPPVLLGIALMSALG